MHVIVIGGVQLFQASGEVALRCENDRNWSDFDSRCRDRTIDVRYDELLFMGAWRLLAVCISSWCKHSSRVESSPVTVASRTMSCVSCVCVPFALHMSAGDGARVWYPHIANAQKCVINCVRHKCVIMACGSLSRLRRRARHVPPHSCRAYYYAAMRFVQLFPTFVNLRPAATTQE